MTVIILWLFMLLISFFRYNNNKLQLFAHAYRKKSQEECKSKQNNGKKGYINPGLHHLEGKKTTPSDRVARMI